MGEYRNTTICFADDCFQDGFTFIHGKKKHFPCSTTGIYALKPALYYMFCKVFQGFQVHMVLIIKRCNDRNNSTK